MNYKIKNLYLSNELKKQILRIKKKKMKIQKYNLY